MFVNQSAKFFCIVFLTVNIFFILYLKTSYENQISTQYASEIFAQNKKNEKNRVLPILNNRTEFGKLMEYFKGKK